MTNSARLSGRPSSSAAYNVGDVVDTPDSAIKSWRYLGAGEWEPNDAVRYTTGPGGGNRIFAAGGSEIQAVGAPRNSLVKIQPTPMVQPYSYDAVQEFSGTTLATGATAGISTDAYCPVTGRPALKIVGGTGQGLCSVQWYNAVTINPAPDDVWIVAVWVDKVVASVELAMTSGSSFADANTYRKFTWLNERVRYGWNFLACGHGNEDYVGASEYGRVGNNIWGGWVEPGSVNATTQVRSIQVRLNNVAESTAYVAGVWLAPHGWCTAAVMFGADDVQREIYDLAIPELERRGFPYTLNVTTVWTNRSTHMTVPMLRECYLRGAEIFAHTNSHTDMALATEADAALELRRSREFMQSNGFDTGAFGMAWPFNSSNHTVEMAARSAGFKIARGYRGRYLNSWQPGHRAFHLPSINAEKANSWHTDAEIKRLNDYGLGGILYMHKTIAGGEGVDTYPGASQHYMAHLRRWLDQCEQYMAAGTMIATNIRGYFRACGIDPVTTPFIEKI